MQDANTINGARPMFPDLLTVGEVNGEKVYKMLCHGCGVWEVIGKPSAGLIRGLSGSVAFRTRHDKCRLYVK